MKQYLDLCKQVLETGIRKPNRTGVDTIGIHGAMMKFDLSEGFPAVTTKQLYWKACFAEMLGFLRGYDNARQFRSLGCNVWDANSEAPYWTNRIYAKRDGDLGRIYGVRWRRWANWGTKPCNATPTDNSCKYTHDAQALVDADLSHNKSEIVGKIFKSTKCGQFKVVREDRPYTGEHLIFDVQFLATGTIVTDCQKGSILLGNIKDPYAVTVAGVGAVGIPQNRELANLLDPTWRDMLYRCYWHGRDNNKWYENASIDPRWLLFENFVADFKQIPRWELKQAFPDLYSLDKDFSGSHTYSYRTCRWSSKVEQAVNSTQVPCFIATDPKGVQHIGKGSRVFAEEHALSAGMVKACVNGTSKGHKGWSFERVGNDFYYSEVDQLREIVAKLLLGVDDRRLIMHGWHPAELEQQALPVCHAWYQFGVEGHKLNLSMYQRSCDMPLGVPFNIAGASLLLSLVARITGLMPGTFTHFLHDVHVYVNQTELLKKQLQRTPHKLPTLRITPAIQRLEDLETWANNDCFALDNYTHDEPIPYPFAV
ncbi:MAG: thymidylate synthase [Pseudomonadota bacterium]|nr:thymidylate synthase [Pseudomonadota bacterium]